LAYAVIATRSQKKKMSTPEIRKLVRLKPLLKPEASTDAIAGQTPILMSGIPTFQKCGQEESKAVVIENASQMAPDATKQIVPITTIIFETFRRDFPIALFFQKYQPRECTKVATASMIPPTRIGLQ
jgi:hypothetical protein